MLIRKGLVGTREPTLRATEVSSAEKVQPRLGIAFFAGKVLASLVGFLDHDPCSGHDPHRTTGQVIVPALPFTGA
jgi:hypothetical protein